MKIKIRKQFFDFEKEEKWLNEMAEKGLEFEKYTLMTYHFNDSAQKHYKYKIELLDDIPGSAESLEYIKFMEDMGIEVVSSWFRWVYFRRDASEGEFELFTDISSRIKHYNRIILMFGIVGGLNFYTGISNLFMGILHEHDYSGLIMLAPMINLLIGLILLLKAAEYLRKIKKMKKENELYDK